jgi:urocanate hydratase
MAEVPCNGGVLQGFLVCFVWGGAAMLDGVLSGTELQRQTLRLYGELMRRRESWAGKLVFACGEGSSGTGLAAAVSIAGGTTLVVDPDGAGVKAVFRAGGVDFVVNSLDEALRVLKNEIRKGRPVSVGLVGEVRPVVAEMEERGVLADLFVSGGEGEAEVLAVELLRMGEDEGSAEWLRERGWSEVVLEGATASDVREMDTELVRVLPEGFRRVWVERIGHYQRVVAGGARVVWLTQGELAGLGVEFARG